VFDLLVISFRIPFLNTSCIPKMSFYAHFLSISIFNSLKTEIPSYTPLLSIVSKFTEGSCPHYSMCSLVPIIRGTGASTMSWREEGREAMNGCHQVNGSRRSRSVKSKWEGDGERKREFSCKR
jgi:hypothetical protein